MENSVVLIDDEVHCTESLELLLHKMHPFLKVTGKFNQAGHALEYLINHPPDLVFLDIEMPEMSGFELLSRVGHLHFDVVFVTAYDQYAIKAFNYSAISYLLKPVDEEELERAVLRWKDKKDRTLSMGQLTMMNELLRQAGKLKTRLALPTQEGLEFIEIKAIIRCESDSNYTQIHCVNQTRHLICRTLKEVEGVLGGNGFLRVHHSHLINVQYIKKFIRNDGGYILMEDGALISVSRGKKDRLFELFNSVERL